LQTANSDVEDSSSRLGDFSKKAGLAFAAAGVAAAAYASKLLIDGVKSAIEDEAAQAKLATTLKNVTGATDAQVKAVEAQILKTSLLTGKTDNELRPSFERLVRATNDAEKAQSLQTLALDIAAGSGKSLEAVSNALGKAFEGNTSALGKLGIGLSAAELKTMSMDEVTAALAKTFGGQASEQAETFAGKMARLNVAFDEAKETVGSYVLDAITPLISAFVDKGIPAIQSFVEKLSDTLGPAFTAIAEFIRDELVPIFKTLYNFFVDDFVPFISSIFKPILEGLRNAFNTIKKSLQDNNEELQPFYNVLRKVWDFIKTYLGPLLGGSFKLALEAIGYIIGGLVSGFAGLVGFIEDVVGGITRLINLIRNNPIVSGIGNLIDRAFGGGRAMGGSVSTGSSYLVGENGPELFVPNSNGAIVPNNKMSGSTININVTGAIDPISVARQIANILNNEASLSGTFNNLGVSRLVAST
jgi:hypothetical protein